MDDVPALPLGLGAAGLDVPAAQQAVVIAAHGASAFVAAHLAGSNPSRVAGALIRVVAADVTSPR